MTPEQRSSEDRTTLCGRPTGGQPGRETFEYDCPRCGKRNRVREGRELPLFACFGCGDAELADALGVELWRLIEDPWQYLAPYRAGSGQRGEGSAGGRREALPGAPEGWEKRLWARTDALAYLRSRGLTDETIREAGIGYGSYHDRPGAFMLAVRDAAGELLTLKERYWPTRWIGPDGETHKTRTLAGRGSHLYPSLRRQRRVILCAGEFDALVTAQEFQAADIYGRAVVTATSGTSLGELVGEFAGRAVAVVYDVGEEAYAERNAKRLCEAGADAWAVPLALPERGDDLNDWFVKYGRGAAELLDLIRRTRRAT